MLQLLYVSFTVLNYFNLLLESKNTVMSDVTLCVSVCGSVYTQS